MRDFVKDAAIVTMAKAFKEAYADVDEFLQKYPDEDYARELLRDLNMINQTWANWDIWNEDKQMFDDGQYIWVWSE